MLCSVCYSSIITIECFHTKTKIFMYLENHIHGMTSAWRNLRRQTTITSPIWAAQFPIKNALQLVKLPLQLVKLPLQSEKVSPNREMYPRSRSLQSGGDLEQIGENFPDRRVQILQLAQIKENPPRLKMTFAVAAASPTIQILDQSHPDSSGSTPIRVPDWSFFVSCE